jgi:hypothetical protein
LATGFAVPTFGVGESVAVGPAGAPPACATPSAIMAATINEKNT